MIVFLPQESVKKEKRINPRQRTQEHHREGIAHIELNSRRFSFFENIWEDVLDCYETAMEIGEGTSHRDTNLRPGRERRGKGFLRKQYKSSIPDCDSLCP